jgi:hypothetical protein
VFVLLFHVRRGGLVWVLTAQAQLNLAEARAATLHFPSPLTPSAHPQSPFIAPRPSPVLRAQPVILPFSPSLQRLAVNLQGAGASAATGPPSCASSLEGGPYPGWQIRPTASPLGALASSAWPTLSTALLEDFPRPTCARSRRSVLLRPSTLQDGIDHCLHLPTKGPSCKILVGAERNNRVSHFPVGESPSLN